MTNSDGRSAVVFTLGLLPRPIARRRSSSLRSWCSVRDPGAYLQLELMERHFDVIDSRTRHLNFGYVLWIEASLLPTEHDPGSPHPGREA